MKPAVEITSARTTKKGTDARRIIQFGLQYGIYILFLALVVAMSFATSTFLTWSNIVNVLLQTSVIAVIAIGMTLVIITQGIDVSVGGIVAIASAVGVGLMKLAGAPWWLGMLAILAVGVLFGLVNGVSVAYLKMPAFLVTLATMGIGRGLTLAFSGGRSWFNLPPQFAVLRQGYVGPIPASIAVVAVLYVLSHVLLSHTTFGRRVYAVGGNPEAAVVSGINVKRIILSVFVLSGLFSGVASVLLTARLNAFWASMGTGFEFSAIAAVVIGGTSLSGGVGNLGGTLIGVLIIGVINNSLNLLGVSAFWQDVARGCIIFIAVMLDSLQTQFVRRD